MQEVNCGGGEASEGSRTRIRFVAVDRVREKMVAWTRMMVGEMQTTRLT